MTSAVAFVSLLTAACCSKSVIDPSRQLICDTVTLSLRGTTNQCIYRCVNLLYHEYYMFRPPVVAIFSKCFCTTMYGCEMSVVLPGCATVSVYSGPPLYAVLLYSAVQHSTVQYSTAQYSTVESSTVQYSTVQYSTVQRSTVQRSTVQYSTAQYSTVQNSTVQYRYCRCVSPGTTV
jgi:hypothetical protein